MGQITIDPAAETEIALFASESGFEVIDAGQGRRAQGPRCSLPARA